MFSSIWLRRLRLLSLGLTGKVTSTAAATRRRSSYRLLVDGLEDRSLLSAGALDPTFGNGAGYVTTSITGYRDIARRALIQPDGKILATGTAGFNTFGLPSAFAVVQYNLDGSPDTSFGFGGIAEAGFGGNLVRDIGGAALQSDGKIVLAGSYNTGSEDVFALARFGTDGTLDDTFGYGGEVTTSFSEGTDLGALGVVIQSDGKVVASGESAADSAFELARYNADGSLDATFGTGGKVVSSFAQFPSLGVRGLLEQPDGKVILVGDTNGGPPNAWLLVRYNKNGTLDTSFGNRGIVATSLSGEAGAGDAGDAAVLYPNAGTPNDGKIVVVGDDSTARWQLVRYNANGSLDTTFGTGGTLATNIGGHAVSVALDASGRIVGTGNGGGVVTLARFKLDGTSDTTFGNGGLVTSTVGSISDGRGIAIYPNAGTANDGKIVVAGFGFGNNFVVARYLGDSPTFAVTNFPSPDTAGVASTFTVTAKNADGTTNTGYTGTVHFTSSDPQAVLPADYPFTAADQGVHTFSATLDTAGIHSLTATDTGNAGTTGGQGGIQVNPPPLQVVPGSFAGTPSGFSLSFNAPLLVNSVTPVLFGQGFAVTAPVPSVTLTGPSGPVEGSLVVNIATNSLTFVETSTANLANNNTPILPDGTYTVKVLSSGPTGIQAQGGGYLDGLGTGSADFTTTFTVHAAAAGEDVVWVPPTADGPGQALNAPGNNQIGGGYPVYLDDSTGAVTNVQVTLNYDPTLLDVTGVTGAHFSLLGASTPGHAVLQYNGPALPAGTQTPIGFVIATVPSGTATNPMPFRAKDILHLSGVSLNGGAIPVTSCAALHVVAYVGDADGNGSYSGNDAALITRVTLQTDTGFAAYPLVDPVIVADTDGAGFIPADAALQVNEAAVGFPTANLPNPSNPSGVVFQPVANNVDPIVSIPVTLYVAADGTVRVPVNINDAHPAGCTGLIEAHLALTYDPHRFTVSPGDVHLGSVLAAGNGWSILPTINPVTGQIAIALWSTMPILSTQGGSLVTIDFHWIDNGDPSGVSRQVIEPGMISLVASVNPSGHQVVATELEDAQGTFTLTPTPSNLGRAEYNLLRRRFDRWQINMAATGWSGRTSET